MRKNLLLALFVFCSALAMAQSKITGKVTSADDGSGIPGVTVSIKGTNNGTQTNASGEYSINASSSQTLVFTFVGMQTLEEPIGNRIIINVALENSVKGLSEVVVTGYGSQIKRDLTGNIAKIKFSELAEVPTASFETSMQGKAAGVQINQGTGKLGQAMQIRVRGQSSVSASNQPLYVIDGIPMTQDDLSSDGGDTNPLVDINPQDIESIEILKDASAGAIYGARAANGVVLITTKKGKSGKTNVNFGYQFGKSKPTKILKFLNTKQYIDFYRMAAGNSDEIEGYSTSDPDSYTAYMESFYETQSLGTLGTANQADTDWGSLAFQDAPTQQYDLSINGGNDKTTFYVSGGLLDQTGILLGNAFSRVSGRMNLNHKVSEKFNFGINMGLTRSLNVK